uniref:Uncharacterized protein n=1 Tax=Octopus bimaculoides TaxID=37653 RepID=A0A0L8HZ72_OCTBM
MFIAYFTMNFLVFILIHSILICLFSLLNSNPLVAFKTLNIVNIACDTSYLEYYQHTFVIFDCISTEYILSQNVFTLYLYPRHSIF